MREGTLFPLVLILDLTSGVWTDWQYLCLLHVQRSGKNEHSFNNKAVLGCGYGPLYDNLLV